MRTARARIDDPEPRAPLWVAHHLTREEWATVLYYTPQWWPGCSAKIGQWRASATVLADPDVYRRERPPEDDPRYQSALRELDRWLLFSPAQAPARAQA